MTRTNHIREAMEEGETALGARCMTRSPLMVEVYADLGFDFVWVDFEHAGPSPYHNPSVEHLTRAADAVGVELLARIPTGEPALIRRVLDAGMRTVLVPRVETADDVRRAVRASRYRYDGGPGERGAASCRASDWGGAGEGYEARADATATVGVMIENRTALGNIEEILAVPELGFAFLGPGDLSVSFGHPGETDHPEVQAALDEVRDACLDAGVPVGRIVNDAERAAEAVEDGYGLLRIGGEVGSARGVLGERLAAVRDRT